MPDNSKFKKRKLNRVTHSLRVSQLIYQYGPGGMVDFPDQTLMTAAPETWATEVDRIYDERLQKALHVDYFGMPSGDVEKGHIEGMSYARFPEWYFCPKCRDFKPISEWKKLYEQKLTASDKEKDPDMVRRIRCTTCKQPLVVSRIVTVCDKGHIDDFPWVEWAHARSKTGLGSRCPHPMMQIHTASSASEGLEGIVIKCKTCNASSSLMGAFDPNAMENLYNKTRGQYDVRCTGRHPWKNEVCGCNLFPVTMQRGSSSIYFPVTVASLVIPPYSNILTSKVMENGFYSEGHTAYKAVLGMEKYGVTVTNEMRMGPVLDTAKRIAQSIGANESAVAEILRRAWFAGDEDTETTDVSYRAEEYEALCGALKVADDKYDGDFVCEKTDIRRYKLPYVKRISLIHKIREVIALTGFSRINPVEGSLKNGPSEGFVSIKEKTTNWYPAYQIRGEGIFVEFDENAINAWRTRVPDVQIRAEQLTENYNHSYIGKKHPRKITSKYLLLHTIAHLLIKQLSFECGYGIASLKERIYCSELADGKEMSGILIYTAGGDSEGTLGGLVRQGRHDLFPGIFRKAIEYATMCSNDPICSLSNGQGRDSLNMAACYSCALLPETSCEDYNAFLDRGVVAGTLRQQDIGFYSAQIKTNWESDYELPQEDTITDSVPENASDTEFFPKLDTGLDTEGIAWTDIWGGIREIAESAKEEEMVDRFIRDAEKFSAKEQPRQDCEFMISDNQEVFVAELLWPKSKVAYFSADNMEGFEAASLTGWHCFTGAHSDVTSDMLLSVLINK